MLRTRIKNNSRGNRGNSNRRQDEWNNRRPGRNQGQSNGQAMQACGFCNLIKENGVSQEYVHRNFKEIHWNVSDKSIWANQCLPSLMLSMDDRIKIVKASNVFCRICLRLMGMGAKTNAFGAGKHITGNGKNTSYSLHDCETNVTLCKKT